MLDTWKRDVASGLIILVPVLVTAYIVAIIFKELAKFPFPSQNSEPAIRVLLLLVVFSVLVLSIGYLMRTAFGDLLEESIDETMNRLPGLRVVYNASKMAVETAVTSQDLQAPVKLETWQGLRMTAFKTGKVTEDGREMLFVPTSPNITTGFVVEVNPEKYTETNETVEEALTRVLSAGFGDSDEPGVAIDIEDEISDDGEVDPGEDAIADD
jgi:uncharacterized membrane protein